MGTALGIVIIIGVILIDSYLISKVANLLNVVKWANLRKEILDYIILMVVYNTILLTLISIIVIKKLGV